MDNDLGLFDDETDGEEFPNLPPELQGKDLTPEKLEKIDNDYETLRDHIIIVFERGQIDELAKFLGLPKIDMKKKNVYTFNEIKVERDYGLL